MTVNRTPLEAQEQITLFQWADMAAAAHPELRMMYHCPNGGFRDAREAHNLRRQGVKAGVPDVCLPVPRGGYHGLYIELKRKKGGRLSEEQRVWLDRLNRLGYRAVCCNGCEAAIAEIKAYLEATP